jgi:hypothetical protein
VLPDSYVDAENKDYGGKIVVCFPFDKFIEGGSSCAIC